MLPPSLGIHGKAPCRYAMAARHLRLSNQQTRFAHFVEAKILVGNTRPIRTFDRIVCLPYRSPIRMGIVGNQPNVATWRAEIHVVFVPVHNIFSGCPRFSSSGNHVVPEWICARVLDVCVGFQVVLRDKFFRWVAPFMPAKLAIMAKRIHWRLNVRVRGKVIVSVKQAGVAYCFHFRFDAFPCLLGVGVP